MTLPITGSGFEFKNKKCDPIFYNEINSKGEEIHLLRVKSKEKDVNFTIKENLCREDDRNESDILMDFISIPFGDIESLEEFFNLNGFLFSIDYEEYSLFKCQDLFLISHRMQLLIEIINELRKDEPDYIKLVKHTSYLLLVPEVSLEVNGEAVYKTANIVNEDFDLHNLTSDSPLTSSDEDIIGENILYLDSCSMSGILTHYYERTNYYEEPNYQVDFISTIYDYINYIDLRESTVLNIDKVSNEIEPTILDTAKKIIKKEIDYHLSQVRPTYNVDLLEASWDIPDLITALYFSILFLNPNFKIIKRCANPKCINYFTVYESNDRKIYCSTRCGNAVSQKRFRENQ